jgi:ABC-type uncharacterized transport system substrate-binding protein
LLIGLLWAASVARADVILLLSDDRPSITGVAQAVQRIYKGRVQLYNLMGDPGRAAPVAEAIRAAQPQQVVAVGLLAARTARQELSSKQVVFCQVLSYEKFDLVTPWMKGVSAVPSLPGQFRAWKLLDPGLRRVGVLTGPDMDGLIAEARAAARENGLELVHVEIESDRQMPFALKELAGSIQGLWLAPDSSILSLGAIRETLFYAARQNIQVLTFAPSLLNEGALLSATADTADIARQVVGRLKAAEGVRAIPGEDVLPLRYAVVTVNPKAAEKFGLKLSTKSLESTDGE